MAYDLGVVDIGLVGAEEIYAYPSNVIFLNGCILGIHSQPNSLVRSIRMLRRKGLIGEFVSVYYDKVILFHSFIHSNRLDIVSISRVMEAESADLSSY